jgi:hypothetical protein
MRSAPVHDPCCACVSAGAIDPLRGHALQHLRLLPPPGEDARKGPAHLPGGRPATGLSALLPFSLGIALPQFSPNPYSTAPRRCTKEILAPPLHSGGGRSRFPLDSSAAGNEIRALASHLSFNAFLRRARAFMRA